MITRLRAKNFKSWRDTGNLRIAPLTGLFGTNSSGKSSILQMLVMLKQTVQSSQSPVLKLGGENSIVDLGTFSDVVHKHNTSEPLRFSLLVDEHVDDSLGFPSTIAHGFEFDAAVIESRSRLRVIEFNYRYGHHVRGMRAHGDAYEFVHDAKITRDVGPPTSFYRFPIGPVLQEDAKGPVFASALEGFLTEISYLGPLRRHPRRTYLWGGNLPRDVGWDGEETAQALIGTHGEPRDLAEPVARWLQTLGLIHSFRVIPIAPNRKEYELRIKTTSASPEVSLPDVGFGISQLLPVVVQCHLAPEGSSILVEQPELHLHPAAQSELGDLLIDAVMTRKVQIILESHSEHLLRRIQRRVAEERFSANDAAMYFCEMQAGESKAIPLEITEDGFIKNWPKNFFGDEMGDLAAMTEAAAKRRLVSK